MGLRGDGMGEGPVTLTLSSPRRKLTSVSVRHIYRCKEYPEWRIERSHITVGESSIDPCPDVWQVYRLFAGNHLLRQCWQQVSEHRTKAAAVKAMGKLIRRHGA